MEEKSIIATNLTTFRKNAGLTQQELADKLNYTDKAVSKWERGEAIPDVLVLKQIADYYGVTLNDIISESPSPKLATESARRRNARHLITTLISIALCFFVATIVMVVLVLCNINTITISGNNTISTAAFCYILTLPIASTVAVVFACLWAPTYLKGIAVSVLVWMVCLAFDITVPVDDSWLIYIVGATLQVLVVLWFILQELLKNKKQPPKKK